MSCYGGMRHLSILIWIKVYYNKNSFTSLEFENFTTFYEKLCFKNLLKGKYIKPKQDSNYGYERERGENKGDKYFTVYRKCTS